MDKQLEEQMKQAQREYNRAYYKANKERINRRRREWYLKRQKAGEVLSQE